MDVEVLYHSGTHFVFHNVKAWCIYYSWEDTLLYKLLFLDGSHRFIQLTKIDAIYSEGGGKE